ncbi:BCCT family transporter [Parasulfitobacter algicola]|uniref:BCCT family transporter n=1 Tax=Parasulfitobacter algicola TaxID=2614809 RepID=A0ABX2IS20_9RHOB|nr:BCCT family transporter [Sulfitobacter algicola]NSX55697.1 BCCT family transporter [Sulfitobacter algicola]
MTSKRPAFNAVFFISLACVAAIGGWGLIDPDAMTGTFLGFTNYMLTGISWYWLLITTGFLILSGYMAFGPYANIRLGKDDERPEFSTASWIAMLFAGGMGAGLLFWGVAEPIYHFEGPPGMQGGTPEAAREALVITNLHWGLHAWSIYGICALVIAYFTFRRGQPSQISTPIRSLFKGPMGKPIATLADVLGVLAVVFGLAGSLTMGTLQVRGGLNAVFGVGDTTTISLIIMGVLFICYMLSATTGVDKGIKILSNLNMVIAIAIMLFVIIFGPSRFILETFTNSIGEYFSRLPAMAFKMFPYEGLAGWTSGWTLTYLIWWLAWGPFVGIFVARISRGRTIREFCIGVIFIPTIFSILWFSAFGGTAIYIELFGGGGLSELVFADVTSALFSFLDYFPLGEILGATACFLIFIFLVTSADSGTFVLSMMTTEGNLNPPIVHKLVWGVLIAILTAGTLLTGSIPVAKAMAITGALPFSIILLLQIVGFLREIRKELPDKTRPKEARGQVTTAAE